METNVIWLAPILHYPQVTCQSINQVQNVCSIFLPESSVVVPTETVHLWLQKQVHGWGVTLTPHQMGLKCTPPFGLLKKHCLLSKISFPLDKGKRERPVSAMFKRLAGKEQVLCVHG